jgi:outer membrane lipoprotein-sorting protein
LIRFLLGLLLLGYGVSGHAEKIVPWALEGLSGVSGTFLSETHGSASGEMFSSSGRFSSLKPDHYLWEIQTPDRQVLLINPEGFWQVDLDLDVAIVRDVPDASELPLAYIWLDQAELQGFSDKVAQGQIEAISEFNLKVLSPTALEMHIVDPLGRTTRFELNIESTEEPEPSLFQPNIPEGADFFDERTRPSSMIGRGSQ